MTDLNLINTDELVEAGSKDDLAKDALVEKDNGESSSDTKDTDVDEVNATADDDPNLAKEKEKVENDESKSDSSEAAKSDVDPGELFSKHTDGRIDSAESLSTILTEYDQLKESSKIKPEPEFPSDRHKKAYEYLTENKGKFEELSTKMHRVLALGDTSKLDAREAQRLAFLLDNDDIPEKRANALFEAEYAQKYGDVDFEDDLLAERRHEKETKAAKETLQNLQESLTAEDSKKQEEADQYVKSAEKVVESIDETMQSYSGLEVPLGEKGEDTLTISLDDKEFMKELPKDFKQQLKDGMAEPAKIIENAWNQMKGKDGDLDYKSYMNWAFKVMAMPQIMSKVYDQGLAAGQAKKLKEGKNSSADVKDSSDPAPKKKSYFDSWAEAAN